MLSGPRMKKGFTLLELIVVIVILGILATLGYSQYTKMVEKMRISEAVANLGTMRQLAYQYWIEHGDLSTITNVDLGVGSSTDQIPSSCRNTHYFYYTRWSPTQSSVGLGAYRCTSGGKNPTYTSGNQYEVYIEYNPSTGSGAFLCWDTVASQSLTWCIP